MVVRQSPPKEPKTLPGQQPDKENQPDKGIRRKEGNPAERDFIAEEKPEGNTMHQANSKTSTIQQQNESNEDQKKEGNPAEKNFTPEESPEEKNAKPQL
jgi:hypothetical protein